MEGSRRGGWLRGESPHGRRHGHAHVHDRPHLSREQVIRAALAIVDGEGLDAFSMRKLGAALGVDPMATYYYFPNKAAVLDGIADAVYAEVAPPPDASAPWDVRLRAVMRSYRHAFRAHPHTLPVLSTHPPSTPLMLRQGEAAIAILHGAGFPPVEAAQAIGCLSGYVIGMTLQEVGLQPGGVPDPTKEEIMATVACLSPDEFPVLSAAYRVGIPYDPDEQFETGLELFIAGLKARYDEIAGGAPAATPSPVRDGDAARPARSRGRGRRG